MYLASLIKRAFKSNLVVTAYVYGVFGHGKTSYALWTAYEVLGDWNKVLSHLFFSPSEAVLVISDAIKRRERLPIIIMDDAGLWLSKLTWWEADKVSFMEFFNMIRNVAGGVIFTTPTKELPKEVVRKCFFRVSVRPAQEDEILAHLGAEGYESLLSTAKRFGLEPSFCMAKGYLINVLPSFMEAVKRDFYDFYPLQYPRPVYEAYEEMRWRATRACFEKWRARVESSKVRSRDELVELAKRLISAGWEKREVVKELMRLGVPAVTAYRWINKILERSTKTT